MITVISLITVLLLVLLVVLMVTTRCIKEVVDVRQSAHQRR